MDAWHVQLVVLKISRSLLKADRMAFAMHLVHNLRPDLMTTDMWEHFLHNGPAPDAKELAGKSHSWVRDEIRAAFHALVNKFPYLAKSCGFDNASIWAPWTRSPDPETAIPGDLASEISPFEQLMVIQALRPDR